MDKRFLMNVIYHSLLSMVNFPEDLTSKVVKRWERLWWKAGSKSSSLINPCQWIRYINVSTYVPQYTLRNYQRVNCVMGRCACCGFDWPLKHIKTKFGDKAKTLLITQIKLIFSNSGWQLYCHKAFSIPTWKDSGIDYITSSK